MDLRGADISGQTVLVNNRFGLKEGDLRSADLRGTDLRGASFVGLYLAGADFRLADLRGVDFQRVHPPGNDAASDLYPGQMAPLKGASGSEIEIADFHGALADSSTRWPSGFDWRAEGVNMT